MTDDAPTDKAREVFVVMYHPAPDNPPRPARIERVFATRQAAYRYIADTRSLHYSSSYRAVESFAVEN